MGPTFKGGVIVKEYRRQLALFGMTVIVAAGLVGCDDKKAQTESHRASPVQVVEVIRQDVPADLSFVAKTESSRAVEIYSRISGFLDKRLYREGGMVQKGQVLFVLDKQPFEVQLKEAEAALDSSKAAHLVAKQNLDRIRPLAKLKALSQSDLDSAEGQFQTTLAQIANAQAQVESAKLNLSYCTITSPVSGYAGSALQTDGTYINTGNSHLTTVYAMSPMWVTFSMSENQEAKLSKEVADGIMKVPANNKFIAEVELAGGQIYKYPGRLTFASPDYNPNTGTFEIRASFPNPDNVLKPQQYVRLIVKGATYPNSIIVPQIAVQQGGKGHFVWVINSEGRAQYRPVTVGSWIGSNWLITNGLEAGDKVGTEGVLTLGPDAPVTIVQSTKQEKVSRPMQDQVAKNMPEFVQDPDQLIQTDPLTGNLISSSSTPSKNPVKAAPEKEIEDKAAPSPTKK